MDLISFLKIAKEEWGKTEQQFARDAKISPTYLGEILAGKKIPRPKIAKKIEIASNGIVTAIEVVQPFYN